MPTVFKYFRRGWKKEGYARVEEHCHLKVKKLQQQYRKVCSCGKSEQTGERGAPPKHTTAKAWLFFKNWYLFSVISLFTFMQLHTFTSGTYSTGTSVICHWEGEGFGFRASVTREGQILLFHFPHPDLSCWLEAIQSQACFYILEATIAVKDYFVFMYCKNITSIVYKYLLNHGGMKSLTNSKRPWPCSHLEEQRASESKIKWTGP